MEKPPVLSDEEIRLKVKSLPPTNLFIPSCYQDSPSDYDQFIAQVQLDAAVEWYEGRMREVSEEIEKGLLSDKEIDEAFWRYSWDELADIFPDTSGRMIDLRRKAVAQAQLDKILSLLRKQ